MKIGTNTERLLSSFNATDANHETPGKQKQGQGLSFSKQSAFPSGWMVLGSQARGGLVLEA